MPARGGFTFIEVLVTLTLLAIASGVLVSAHTALLHADGSSSTRLRAGLELQTIQSDLLNGAVPTNRPVQPDEWGIAVEILEPVGSEHEMIDVSLTPPGKDVAMSSLVLSIRKATKDP